MLQDWILEDADKHKWSFQDFFLPLSEWNLNVSREERNWYQDYLYKVALMLVSLFM